MSRQDTVNKYIDAFLKGRGPEACEKFRAKDLSKQYSSIMQWRRKMRIIESTPKSTRDIIEALKRTAQMISNAPEMTEQDAATINNELQALHSTLDQTLDKHRQEKIRLLEEESRRIASQLQQLKSSDQSNY